MSPIMWRGATYSESNSTCDDKFKKIIGLPMIFPNEKWMGIDLIPHALRIQSFKLRSLYVRRNRVEKCVISQTLN